MTTDFSYVITPFLAWLVAGCCKFAVNCLRERRLAFDLIGYGGMPSNHSAIVSSTVALIALKEGLDSPVLGVAVTLAFIVMLDATSLRRHVGRHAQAINRLAAGKETLLRERVGHSRFEVLAGIFVGTATAFLVTL